MIQTTGKQTTCCTEKTKTFYMAKSTSNVKKGARTREKQHPKTSKPQAKMAQSSKRKMQEVESASSGEDSGKHKKASQPPKKCSRPEEVVEVDEDVEAEDASDDEAEVIDLSGESEGEVCKSSSSIMTSENLHRKLLRMSLVSNPITMLRSRLSSV